MIINFLRALLILILIYIIIVDVELPIIINTPTNQLFIGILIIITMLVVDEIIGFVLGLIFLILYFKFYQKKINPSSKTTDPFSQYLLNPLVDAFNNTSTGADTKPKPYSLQPVIPEHFVQNSADNSVTTMPYISNELLKAAQTNIYDEKNYNLEIMQDGGNFYGIQGLNSDNKHYEAFDNKYTQYNSV